LIMLFCNGPRTVNPFVASSLRRVTLLSVVGARPPPDGIRWGGGRPIWGRV